MQLSRVEIRNYKSLRDVTIEPGAISVFVGPNAAGKTNFVDALDFLGDVYRWGLEAAVSHKGGYENISYRHSRRTKAPLQFRLIFTTKIIDPYRLRKENPIRDLSIEHTFDLRTGSQGIEAPFGVTSEKLLVYEHRPRSRREVVRVTRTPEGVESAFAKDARWMGPIFQVSKHLPFELADVTTTDLLFPTTRLIRYTPLLGSLAGHIASLKVFQLSPRNERQPGVPTPNPDLDRFGTNLPAVIAFLKKEHPEPYKYLLDCAKRVMPSLEEIETGFTHTKTLALFLKEKGFARPWAADDVSDGTLQTIALLTAIFDPRAKIVVIEEPENSVHPWALRNLVAAVRLASESKQIMLTTHSPILVDQLRPDELWIVQRPAAETRIDPLLRLDPSLKDDWGKGKFTLSDYLDSGAVPDAVPSVAS
jgi:predicted ATPase